MTDTNRDVQDDWDVSPATRRMRTLVARYEELRYERRFGDPLVQEQMDDLRCAMSDLARQCTMPLPWLDP